MSYHTDIIKKLVAGEQISPLTAFKEFGCLSLPQRISELRKMGYPIKGEMVKTANNKRHNIYWIEMSDRQAVKQRYFGA